MASRVQLGPLWLISNGSATSEPQEWKGGRGVFMSEHVGGAVSLEFALPGPADTYAACGADTTLAAPGGAGVFYLPPGTHIRAAVSGGATGVYCYVGEASDFIQ